MTSIRWVYASLLLAMVSVLGCTQAPIAGDRSVLVLTAKGPVTPVMAQYINRGITLAETLGATAVVLQIDTPGGLDTAMRDIVQRINAAKLPVISYVGPAGARAASAGAFIVMASHVAVMAPTTAIGAAHPVSGDGSDIQGAMNEKVTNDAAAYIRGIAQQRGRNADWAERAVRDSVSASAEEAKRDGVVDAVANDLPAALAAADGRRVTLTSGAVTVQSRDVVVRVEEMNLFESLLAIIATPNVAFLLMSLATLGIYLELSNPGSFLPGIVGALSLVLGLFALGALPINNAALLLLGLGFALLVAEVWVTSGGLLALGGGAAVALGGAMLMSEAAPPSLEVNRWLIAAVVLVLVVPSVLVGRSVAHLKGRKPTEGLAAMVGLVGVARTELAPLGTVLVRNELWQATTDGETIAPGEKVRVTVAEGLTLRVIRESAPAISGG